MNLTIKVSLMKGFHLLFFNDFEIFRAIGILLVAYSDLSFRFDVCKCLDTSGLL